MGRVVLIVGRVGSVGGWVVGGTVEGGLVDGGWVSGGNVGQSFGLDFDDFEDLEDLEEDDPLSFLCFLFLRASTEIFNMLNNFFII